MRPGRILNEGLVTAMLEYMLVIIAVVAALVAIIVNRRSLMACVVITVVSAALCCGFLLLYENTYKLGSYGELVSTVLIGAGVLTAILIVVTFIGVKMHFMKKPLFSKKSGSKPLPFEVQTPANTNTSAPGAASGSTKYGTRPTPVGIFGRQPIEKPKPRVTEPVAAAPTPAFAGTPYQAPAQNPYAQPAPAPAPAPEPAPAPQDAALQRMLTRGEQFLAMKQYVLAEQMFTTFIQRCTDPAQKIDAELKLLNCHVDEGNREKATARLNEMIAKMRSGEYVFAPEQKRELADCKMRLMKM